MKAKEGFGRTSEARALRESASERRRWWGLTHRPAATPSRRSIGYSASGGGMTSGEGGGSGASFDGRFHAWIADATWDDRCRCDAGWCRIAASRACSRWAPVSGWSRGPGATCCEDAGDRLRGNLGRWVVRSSDRETLSVAQPAITAATPGRSTADARASNATHFCSLSSRSPTDLLPPRTEQRRTQFVVAFRSFTN